MSARRARVGLAALAAVAVALTALVWSGLDEPAPGLTAARPAAQVRPSVHPWGHDRLTPHPDDRVGPRSTPIPWELPASAVIAAAQRPFQSPPETTPVPAPLPPAYAEAWPGPRPGAAR
jgi:hypothetical protein